MTDDLQHLKSRLQEAQQARAEYTNRSPTVSDCLICDEYQLAVRDGDGSYERLDCHHDHYESIIEGSHDHGGIGEWIRCIEYITENGEVD
jgi:hypothetical protein